MSPNVFEDESLFGKKLVKLGKFCHAVAEFLEVDFCGNRPNCREDFSSGSKNGKLSAFGIKPNKIDGRNFFYLSPMIYGHALDCDGDIYVRLVALVKGARHRF